MPTPLHVFMLQDYGNSASHSTASNCHTLMHTMAQLRVIQAGDCPHCDQAWANMLSKGCKVPSRLPISMRSLWILGAQAIARGKWQGPGGPRGGETIGQVRVSQP